MGALAADDPMTLPMRMRDGLRRLAKAVVVITCEHNGTRFAMAATAVSELCIEPPSLLICVNRTASLFEPLSTGANFTVNILHSSHETVSAACSGKLKGEARFEHGQWARSSIGPPLFGRCAGELCVPQRSPGRLWHAWDLYRRSGRCDEPWGGRSADSMSMAVIRSCRRTKRR